MPTLYLLPTPLADQTADQVLSPQVREIVRRVDAYLVENVRTARRFISSLGTGRVIDELRFFDLHKDTPETDTRSQLSELFAQGTDAAVLAEAGCPGVADPGAVAARLAHGMGWRVAPLVGPSSLLLALMASGLNGQSFAFHGYLPIDKAERAKALRQLEKEARQRRQTQLFIETPYRNQALLGDILAHCQPDTQLCVACNLTAPDEYIRTGSVRDWRKMTPLPDLHKKPTVFLLL